ncbi:hypothetical protein MPH_13446, partial [Macrophomina phaseolina MS6]
NYATELVAFYGIVMQRKRLI